VPHNVATSFVPQASLIVERVRVPLSSARFSSQISQPKQKKQEEIMRNLRVLTIALCAVLLCGTLVPGARASESDKKTIATFSGAVEIPGQVLQPGIYVFKLLDSSSNRNIVQVWNEDEDQLLATILAISDERPQASDKSVFSLEQFSTDSTPALRSWFYPGEKTGRRFVYPQYPTTEQSGNSSSVR
jgi:hypothetical protein